MKNKKQIRENFRNDCLKRDGYRCVMCGFKPNNVEALDVHHICDRKLIVNGGFVKENGITLCCDRTSNGLNCHLKAEQFHITGISHQNYSPEDLYLKIGSSYEEAVTAAEKL